MELLDLPPEIFERVITHLVTSAGIVAVWQHRKVCRTFRRSIEFETFANQPTRAFLQAKEANARSLLRKNAALYLRYRSTAEKGAYPFLPRFIKRISDFVCASLLDGDYKTRKKYTRVLCNLLIKEQRRYVHSLIETKAPEVSHKTFRDVPGYHEDISSNYIAAAAAVGNLRALRVALKDDPDEVWQRSPVFGYPLVVAVAGHHLSVVSAIVKHFEHTQHRTHMAAHQRHFTAAISTAFKGRDRASALLLLQVFHAYGSRVETRDWEVWISVAISMRDSAVIHQVCVLRRHGVADMSQSFRAACNEGDVEAVRMFIDEGYVPLRCLLSCWRNSTPIQTAVASKQPAVVEKLLKMGANPNSDWAPTMNGRPLWMAIAQNSKEIALLLLRYGADPGLVKQLWEEQPQSFKDSRANIRDMMVQAEQRGNYYVLPTEPMTKFAIDAPNLVVSEQTNEDEEMEEEVDGRGMNMELQPQKLSDHYC